MSSKAITYASVSTVADLSASPVTTADAQIVNDLEIGDEVYVLDQYGKKGIIKVTGLVASFGSDGFIQHDIKIEK